MSVRMRQFGTIALALALALPPMPALAGEDGAEDPAIEAIETAEAQEGIDDEGLAPAPEGEHEEGAVDESTPPEEADGEAEAAAVGAGEDGAPVTDDAATEAAPGDEADQEADVPREAAPAPMRAAAARDVSSCEFSLLVDGSAPYTGSAITPAVRVVTRDDEYNATELAEGTDYTLSYANNTGVGTATVTVTGTGEWGGSFTLRFQIVAADISGADVSAIPAQTYTGSALKPKPTVKLGGRTLKEGTDYTLSYKDNTKAGNATVIVRGTGGYTGSVAATFEIARADVSKASVTGLAAQTYTGKALTPKPTVKVGGRTLKEGTDYTLSYSGNTKAGTATVTVKGKGNYKGAAKATFSIARASLKGASVSKVGKVGYTGKAKRPKPTVKVGGKVLKEGTDYTLSYKNNRKRGKATVTVTGKGNYKGSLRRTFRIVSRKSLKSRGRLVVWSPGEVDGRAVRPWVEVRVGSKVLKEGTDYTLSYKWSAKTGTMRVTARGKGLYKGTLRKTLKGTRYPLGGASVSLAAQTYTGSALKPKPTVKLGGKALKEGRDYTLSYANNTKAGTATVTVKGKGVYKGTKKASFAIARPDVSKASVTGLATQTYTGKALKPKLTVKVGGRTLKEGTDYTLSYASNVAKGKGTARVTVTGIGNYRGTKTGSFSIGTWVEDGRKWVVDKAAGEYCYRNTTGGNLYKAKPMVDDDGNPVCSRSFEKLFTNARDTVDYIFEMGRKYDDVYLSYTFFVPGQKYWIWEDEVGHWETTGHWEY